MTNNKRDFSDKLVPFRNFFSIADMIVETFGENCEVVIHDFRNLNESLVYINGNVTDRRLGAPVTNLILKDLHKYGNQVKDKLAFLSSTNDGKFLKTSITFIRDKSEDVIGCLGINYDITELMMADKIIKSLCKTKGIEVIENNLTREYYPKNIEEVFGYIIQDTINHFDLSIDDMKKEDKLKFVEMLDEKGAFMIQGAIEKVSEILNVSRQSIYNYLDEIRSR